MNCRAILNIVSLLVMVTGCAMLTSVPVALICGDSPDVVRALLLSSVFSMAFSLAGIMYSRRPGLLQNTQVDAREGFASVAFAWLAVSIFGALPFITVSGMRFADAVFETASGLSTTGASVISSDMVLLSGKAFRRTLEDLPSGLLYWRSLLNWLGGVGIVVFVLLILPLLGAAGGHQLYNAEVPGIKTNSDQATPRLVSSAKIILVVYVLLTALAAAVYMLGGMPPFDAFCHSFSTISTGGFSTKNASFGGYSPFLQWSAVVFMLVSACNFTLTIKIFTTRKIWYFRDEEFKFFLTLSVLASLVIAALIYWKLPGGVMETDGSLQPHTFTDSLRVASFQVASVISSTGFVTSDCMQWKIPAALMILFLLMFPCGCGGSTAGGMKCSRVLLVIKQTLSELRHCIFPRSITDIRLNGERLDASVVSKTMAFMSIFLLLFLLTALLLPIVSPHENMDFMTALSASLACISNVGPGLGKVGPVGNYAWMSDAAKYLLSFEMLAGRLELYTCLVIFLPSFWKK